MRSIDEIFKLIMDIEGVNTYYALSKVTGIPQTTISACRKRNNIPFDYLLKYCEVNDVSFDWLVRGIENKSSPKQYAIVNIPPGLTKEDIELYVRTRAETESMLKEKDLLDQKIHRIEQALSELDDEDRNRILNGFLAILGAI